MQISGRTNPRPATTTTTFGLFLGPYQQTVMDKTRSNQVPRMIIGAGGRVELDHRPLTGEQHLGSNLGARQQRSGEDAEQDDHGG